MAACYHPLCNCSVDGDMVDMDLRCMQYNETYFYGTLLTPKGGIVLFCLTRFTVNVQ